MAHQPSSRPPVEAADTLYTSLLIIAAAMLLIGVIFIVARSFAFFGSLWPPGGGT